MVTDLIKGVCTTQNSQNRNGDNYWDLELNGQWLQAYKDGRYKFTLKEVKEALAK